VYLHTHDVWFCKVLKNSFLEKPIFSQNYLDFSCQNHDFGKINKISKIENTPQRYCGFNPQSPAYNALNKGVAGQARNDEHRRDGACPVPTIDNKNNLDNPENLDKIVVQTKTVQTDNKQFNNKYKLNKFLN